MKKLNLNAMVKVKLTPVGVNIFYNQYDSSNENRMPSIDKDGFTEMQLWNFVELFGKEIGVTKPNVVQDVSIYIDEKDLDDTQNKN